MNIFSAAGRKLAMFPDLVERWSRGELVTPVAVEFQLSERCTNHCPRCQAKLVLGSRETKRRATSGADLDLEIIAGVLSSLPPKGIIVSGNSGDPLQHPRFEEIMKMIRDAQIPAVLICNGHGFTPDIARQCALTFRGIRVSLDAWDSSSYLRSHGVGISGWLHVLETMRTLVAAKRCSATPCTIGAGFLTGPQSTHGMVKAARLVQDIGMDYIQFRPFHGDVCDVSSEVAAAREVAGADFRIFASDQKYSRQDMGNERGYDVCHGGHFYTVIDAQGDVYICCHHIGRERAKVGNLHQASWADIVSSQTRREIITRFPDHTCVPLCRLHDHNEALHQIRSCGRFAAIALTSEVADHAVFL